MRDFMIGSSFATAVVSFLASLKLIFIGSGLWLLLAILCAVNLYFGVVGVLKLIK